MTSEDSDTLDTIGLGNPSEQDPKIGFGVFGNLVGVIRNRSLLSNHFPY